jgi:hypothetical protein
LDFGVIWSAHFAPHVPDNRSRTSPATQRNIPGSLQRIRLGTQRVYVVTAYNWTVSTAAENKTKDFERNEDRKMRKFEVFKQFLKTKVHELNLSTNFCNKLKHFVLKLFSSFQLNSAESFQIRLNLFKQVLFLFCLIHAFQYIFILSRSFCCNFLTFQMIL